MATTYRKTVKGVDEVLTRANRLTPRARNTLILIDAARTDEDIAKLIQVQALETLQQLLQGGFIEVIAVTAAPPQPAALPPADAAASQRAALDFQHLQREAVHRLLDLIGPAGEALAMRMESARDLEQLRPLLVTARAAIANMRGQQVAAGYISALGAL